VEDAGRYGLVRLSPDNRIISFSEKGTSGAGLINAGVYLLDRGLIGSMPAGTEVSLERDLFPRLVGHGLHGFHLPGPFLDIGIPSDYHRAADFFASWHRSTGQSKGQT
jgi:NDP-sugar pyrophosphorylase family protein